MINLLTDVIYYTFKNSVGSYQRGKENPKALLVSFKLIGNVHESGYRYLDLLVYGPSSYVSVFVRRRWNIIHLVDMYADKDGDLVPKQGKHYISGQTAWDMLVCHNSEWKDIGIKKTLLEYEYNILSFEGLDNFYKIIDCPNEILRDY